MTDPIVTNDIVLWGAVLGLLVGIIWSLRFIVVLDRKIESMDWKIERILARVSTQETKIIKELKPKIALAKKKKR